MNVRDLAVDLTDELGRLFSGAIVLLNLIIHSIFIFNLNIQFQTVYTYFKEMQEIYIFLFIAISYILGECSLFFFFQLARILKAKGFLLQEINVLETIISFDKTSNKKILSFYKQQFGLVKPNSDKVTKPTYERIHDYCKEALVQTAPLAHTHARRFESKINFYAGIAISSLVSIITVLIYCPTPYNIGAALVLLIVLYVSFERFKSMSMFSEPMLIYLNYYLAFANNKNGRDT